MKEAIRLDPQLSEAYLNLGQAYSGNEEFPKAIAALQASIKLDPQESSPYYQLAQVYKKQGLMQEAATPVADI